MDFLFCGVLPRKLEEKGVTGTALIMFSWVSEDRRFKPQFKFYKPNFFHDNYIPVFCFLWNWDFTVAKWYIFMQGEWETVDGDCIWFIAWLRIHWCTDLECSLLNQQDPSVEAILYGVYTDNFLCFLYVYEYIYILYKI